MNFYPFSSGKRRVKPIPCVIGSIGSGSWGDDKRDATVTISLDEDWDDGGPNSRSARLEMTPARARELAESLLKCAAAYP